MYKYCELMGISYIGVSLNSPSSEENNRKLMKENTVSGSVLSFVSAIYLFM